MVTKRPLSPSILQVPCLQTKRSRKCSSSVHGPSPERTSGRHQRMASSLARLELQDLPGGEVFYVPTFVDCDVSKDWYRQLDELETWYHPTLKVYGKEVCQSRSIAAYATSQNITVKYSGHQVNMHYAYPSVLSEIQDMVEKKLGVKFNHVMLNRYSNGKEYIGKHRDTKENKVIASLSLGAERTFILTPNKHCPSNPKPRSLLLQSGSLLVMQGDTQKNWKHEIPKELKVEEGRISLTFRQLESG